MIPPSTRVALLVWTVCVVLIAGCSDTEDCGNPYDPLNPLTAGSPPNVTVLPGDREATVTWFSFGVAGIDSYLVYRRFEGDVGSKFLLVGETSAVVDSANGRETPGHRYVYVDEGLDNDQVDEFTGQPIPYQYRLAVVDIKGVETPDPASPPELTELSLVYWPSQRVTPSEAPEPPRPELFVDDLVVILSWPDYKPPGDADLYRVYASHVASSRTAEFVLLDEIPIEGEVLTDLLNPTDTGVSKRYADRAFDRDGTTKEYAVTAVDRFGVESTRGIEHRYRATVPNLPPKPLNWAVTDVIIGGPGTYQVDFQWSRAPEADFAGYNIYATDGANPHGWRVKKTIRNRAETRFTLNETAFILPRYFVTAFDNTPRDGGGFDQVYPPGYRF